MVSLKKLGHVNLAIPRIKIILQNMAFPFNQFCMISPLGKVHSTFIDLIFRARKLGSLSSSLDISWR
jgi:hypothetical protein